MNIFCILGTYERTSIDLDYQFVYGVADESEKKTKTVVIVALVGVGAGVCIGTGTCVAIAAGTVALLKKSLSYSTKIVRQMPKRGWTKSQVEETVKNASTTAKTTFKETGKSATAYINKDGSYVVVENATQKIIQISDKTRPWDFPKDWIWK